MSVEASDGVFTMSVSKVILFRFLNTNLQFHFCSALLIKKPTHQQHRKKIPTATTELGKCRLNHMMTYIRLAFTPFFCHVHFSLTLIFIIVQRLLFSISLFLYYNTSISCIFRNLHNIRTQQQQPQRRG